jgi:hypothetical protein
MDILRWIFFLSLALLLIASCNNATAQFESARRASALAAVQPAFPADFS